MLDMILQMCTNLAIMLINAFMYFKTSFLGLPYGKIFIILLTAYFVYKMSLGEIDEIKQPYTKAGRRRI